MNIQDKILYCRKKAGLSQDGLAEQIGVSRQSISKWETGEAAPEINKLGLLAKTFGVTTDWLLSDAEPENKDTAAENRASGSSHTESLASMISRIGRRFGWLAGVYTALGGIAFVLAGWFARYSVRKMITTSNLGFDAAIFGGNAGWVDAYGNPLADAAIKQLNDAISSSPVYITGTGLIVLGIVVFAAGIILAIYLKKRYSNPAKAA